MNQLHRPDHPSAAPATRRRKSQTNTRAGALAHTHGSAARWCQPPDRARSVRIRGHPEGPAVAVSRGRAHAMNVTRMLLCRYGMVQYIGCALKSRLDRRLCYRCVRACVCVCVREGRPRIPLPPSLRVNYRRYDTVAVAMDPPPLPPPPPSLTPHRRYRLRRCHLRRRHPDFHHR